MNRRFRPAALLGLIATLFLSNLFAHHSAAPHFDLEKTIMLDGTITKFEFVNPHGYVYFTVKGGDGKPVPWRCELAARTSLARLGWTPETFPVGKKMQIKGAPARREEHVCMLTSFIAEDGREIGRNDDLTKGGANPLATLAHDARPARLADGHPNLSGPWVSRFGPGGRGPGGRGDKKGEFKKKGGPGGPPGAPEATDAGLLASKSYDQRFDDPAIQCNPANIIFGFTHDQHVNEIEQKGDSIILRYGYMDFVRTVHMNLTEHPQKIQPSTAGHSIGKWEGDVLVVDTVGFKPGVLIPLSGLMHSGQMQVTERFSVNDETQTLTREFRATDPLYLKSVFTGNNLMDLSKEPYVRYNCVELSGKNNIRPK